MFNKTLKLLIVTLLSLAGLQVVKQIEVYAGEEKIYVTTSFLSTEKFIDKQARALVGDKFIVDKQVDKKAYLKNGEVIKLYTEKEVKLTNGKEVREIKTYADTVGQLLTEEGITLDSDDYMNLPTGTYLTEGMDLQVTYYETRTVVEKGSIPFEKSKVDDPELTKGEEEVRTPGVNGEKELTYQNVYQNGALQTRKLISEAVVKEPVTEVTAVGTKEEKKEEPKEKPKEEASAPAAPVSGTSADWMKAAGIPESDWGYVDSIISKESGWNYTISNSGSGAYGLPQALPGSKMASAGADWETNPVTQLKWATGYAESRYGSWQAAYEFWQSHHWW